MCSSANSLMSKRMYARSSPKISCVSVFASSVLPTPVGPAKNSTPRGRLPAERACAPVSPITERIRMSIALVAAARWPFTRSSMNGSAPAMRSRR